MRPAAIAFLVLTLAGCAGPAPPTATSPPPPVVELSGCDQTHVLLTFPAEAFAGTLPEGWALASDDAAGRTAKLELYTSDCDTATFAGTSEGRYAEMWGHLLVVPPNGTTEGASDRWPIGGASTSEAALAAYEEWGLHEVLAIGDVGVYPMPISTGDFATVVTQARTAEEHFFVRAEENLQPGAWPEGAIRLWIPGESDALGSLRFAWDANGTQVGVGSGALQYEGPLLNAAPLYPGIEHRVGDVNVRVTRWDE